MTQCLVVELKSLREEDRNGMEEDLSAEFSRDDEDDPDDEID